MSVLPDGSLERLSIDDIGHLLEEWRDWNSGYSWKPDAGGYLSDVFHLPNDPVEGRARMKKLYGEAVRRWREAGYEFNL